MTEWEWEESAASETLEMKKEPELRGVGYEVIEERLYHDEGRFLERPEYQKYGESKVRLPLCQRTSRSQTSVD